MPHGDDVIPERLFENNSAGDSTFRHDEGTKRGTSNMIKQKFLAIGVFIIIISIILLILFSKSIIRGVNEQICIKTDYTKCINVDDIGKTCFDTPLDTSKTCTCKVNIDLSHDMKGNITLYYELESYDQTDLNYSRSRDDKQLSGILQTPSADCGEYANSTSGKPIAPCGRVADTMFTDSYKLAFNNGFLDVLTTGLVNKTGYRNPPVNVITAFKDYAKPKSWDKNVWELDAGNPENNGFENEAFIAWMRTDLKRKPAWRIDQVGRYKDGLPAGLYRMRILYAYHPKRYNGSRILWLCPEKAENDCVSKDYTRCTNLENVDETCFDTLLNYDKPTCKCYFDLNVTSTLLGKVMLYYELKSFDQTEPSYARSRDNKQLSGILSQTLSPDCEGYANDASGRPIAPCGRVADTMFTDTFMIGFKGDFLNVSYTGLIGDKTGYTNPPVNLTQAFEVFDKPKNWVKNVWELDPENPDNNGFQNEAFIAWMRTELKRKPAWRLDQTAKYTDGLPAGSYTLQISYAYPVSRYNGNRVVWLCGERHIPDEIHSNAGLICFLVALMVVGIIFVVYAFKSFIGEYIPLPFRDQTSTP